MIISVQAVEHVISILFQACRGW